MLPIQYRWLEHEMAPKMIVEFVKIFGIHETIGEKDNPVILSWAKELGLEKIYVHDVIPWCGLAMGIIAKRAGKPVVKDPLWARNWLNFGTVVPNAEAKLGDDLVFSREGGTGHVGLYIAEDKSSYHVGGGNESDQVNIVRIAKYRLLGVRRPEWKIAQPSQVRKIYMDEKGNISTNEI